MIQEEKEQYFAQYWGQRVFKMGKTSPVGIVAHLYIEEGYLELTNLKNISDEDAIAVSNMLEVFVAEHFITALITGDHYICRIKRSIHAYQYLQSKGYALPWRQYTVEDLINEGVLKLK